MTMRREYWFAIPLLLSLSRCAPRTSDTLRVGVSNLENEADLMGRYEPLRVHLEKKFQKKATLRTATDYAGIIEALRSGQLDMAYMGPAAYARAWIVTGGHVKPLIGTLDAEGSFGYHSMIVVRADSPYRTVADLKGKSIAFADPNSTSGFIAPSFFLREEGFDPKTHFGRSGFAGSHEMGVLAAYRGTYDAAASWWYSEGRTAAARMELKNLLPKGAMRIIWRSPRMPASAWVVRDDMPAATEARIREAILSFPREDPAGFATLSAAREGGYREVKHADYEPVIRMVREDAERRKE
jgi:phosphonate transport system substrate-binding protein